MQTFPEYAMWSLHALCLSTFRQRLKNVSFPGLVPWHYYRFPLDPEVILLKVLLFLIKFTIDWLIGVNNMNPERRKPHHASIPAVVKYSDQQSGDHGAMPCCSDTADTRSYFRRTPRRIIVSAHYDVHCRRCAEVSKGEKRWETVARSRRSPRVGCIVNMSIVDGQHIQTRSDLIG